jgi:hypothetical protein
MTLDDLGNIGELVAAVGVIVSLIYLAFQIRQNTRSVKINTFQALAASRTEFAGAVVENPEVSTLLFAGLRDYEALQRDDRTKFAFLIYKLLAGIENQLFQYGQGELPTDQFEHIRSVIRWYARWPGFHAWWKDHPIAFGDTLTEFVENELREVQSSGRAAQEGAEADGQTA